MNIPRYAQMILQMSWQPSRMLRWVYATGKASVLGRTGRKKVGVYYGQAKFGLLGVRGKNRRRIWGRDAMTPD